MNQQNPPFENNAPTYPIYQGAYRAVETPQTAWKSAPAAVRFAVWVWAISVIASLAGAAILIVLFAVGLNLAILGGSR